VSGRHAQRRIGKGAKVSLIVVCLLVVTGGGATFAAYRYDRATIDRILPGVSVAGVDVSGMTRNQATAAVQQRSQSRLSSPITITAGGKRWRVSASDLGMRSFVTRAVDRAVAVSGTLDTASRVWHRLRDEPVDVDIPLRFRVTPATVESFVQRVSEAVTLKPTAASLTVENGRVVTHRSEPGRTLDPKDASKRILSALRSGSSSVALKTQKVAPKVTEKTLGATLVIRRDVHRLYLYDGFRVVKTYPVATAAAGYETPPGSWTVVNKQENPTWTNPAPDTWGAGLPASIPPGPGNPLGTRALYLNAPGIRIHGTYDVASVGTNASHGCIRMFMADIEALYPLVPIGTPVYVV
jgi:lipoprotein-anchoring transpeptidase ErfK/SrfK